MFCKFLTIIFLLKKIIVERCSKLKSFLQVLNIFLNMQKHYYYIVLASFAQIIEVEEDDEEFIYIIN